METMQATGRRNRKWEYFDLMGKLLEDDPQFRVNNFSGKIYAPNIVLNVVVTCEL